MLSSILPSIRARAAQGRCLLSYSGVVFASKEPAVRTVCANASLLTQHHYSESPRADEESIEEIRARIFDDHIGNNLRSGRKVLRKKQIGDVLMSWYPPKMEKGDPFFVDVDEERRKAKLETRRRRGKAPPKKGEGKRASKKK